MTAVQANREPAACGQAAPPQAPAAANNNQQTEDRWDYSHHQAFVGGMNQAQYFAHQQQQQQPRPTPPAQGFAEILASYLMHMAAQRVAGHAVGIAEWAIFAAGRGVRDGYRWCFPLTPEQLVRQAQFTRGQIQAFMQAAIVDNATFVLVQPHRLSDAVRASLVRDGYRIENGQHQGEPATRIYFVRAQAGAATPPSGPAKQPS